MDCSADHRCPPLAPRGSDPGRAPVCFIKGVGLELAVGFGFEAGPGGPSHALALHGAMPLALVHAGHFTFIGAPGIDFGFSFGASRGVMIAASAKVGGETHFGFMGIPQLALQGTVGFHVRFEHAAGDALESTNAFRVGTTVEGQPWENFTNSISAIYYFDEAAPWRSTRSGASSRA